MRKEDPHRYDDMLSMERPVSRTHPPMSMHSRAAQFAPFAALTGYEAAIDETARRTDRRRELDEDAKKDLDEKMQWILTRLNESEYPEVSITYFVKDAKKEGGSYPTVTGRVKKLRDFEQRLVLMDGMEIPIGDIVGFHTLTNEL